MMGRFDMDQSDRLKLEYGDVISGGTFDELMSKLNDVGTVDDYLFFSGECYSDHIARSKYDTYAWLIYGNGLQHTDCNGNLCEATIHRPVNTKYARIKDMLNDISLYATETFYGGFGSDEIDEKITLGPGNTDMRIYNGFCPIRRVFGIELREGVSAHRPIKYEMDCTYIGTYRLDSFLSEDLLSCRYVKVSNGTDREHCSCFLYELVHIANLSERTKDVLKSRGLDKLYEVVLYGLRGRDRDFDVESVPSDIVDEVKRELFLSYSNYTGDD